MILRCASFAFFVLATSAQAAPPPVVNGPCLVVGVSDGDTIKTRCGAPGAYEQLRVRLNAIDAPERKQAFGNRARQAMSALVFQRFVDLRCTKMDMYRRHVCAVFVAPADAPDGPQTVDAGLALVRDGLAWWYRAYAREQAAEDRTRYELAEDEARTARRGLWADAAPVAPWDWRRDQREARAQRKRQ